MLAIVFLINNARYALSCENVVEVIPRVSLQPVAQPTAGLAGVFVYRGSIMPVLDLCQLLGGYPCPVRLSSRIVVVRCEQAGEPKRLVGFLAEDVTETRLIDANARAGGADDATFSKRMLLDDGQILQLLDTRAMLANIAPVAPLLQQRGS
jgi:chemotaxis-related protein WspB